MSRPPFPSAFSGCGSRPSGSRTTNSGLVSAQGWGRATGWAPDRAGADSRVPAVEECLLDQDSMLIPIAVGGALAGLVLIVLIAYLIGRKRSHAGYQTI